MEYDFRTSWFPDVSKNLPVDKVVYGCNDGVGSRLKASDLVNSIKKMVGYNTFGYKDFGFRRRCCNASSVSKL